MKNYQNDVYLYVGENIRFIDDNNYNRYSLFSCISGKDIDLRFNVATDGIERFEEKANVIRLNDEVFNKLLTVRHKGDNELEYGLSDEIIRGIKYDYREMTEEFDFTPKEASQYIKKFNK